MVVPVRSVDTLVPAANMVLYHGVLAPRARWRWQFVSYGRPVPDGIALKIEARRRTAAR